MRRRWAAAVLLVAFVTGACGGSGGSDDGGVVSLDDGSGEGTSTTRLATDEAVLEVTRCMRDNGIDVPDVGLTADGRLDLRPEDLVGIDLDSEEFQAAFATCIAAFRTSGGFDVALDPELEALFQDQLQEFSQCMRDNGIADFPDPRTGAGTPYPLTAWVDFDDPAFQAALESCRETVSFGGFTG